MRGWLFLTGAVVSEVSASLALKGALDDRGWYALVGTGYVVSFTCLWLALRAGLPLGVAYGVWGALGVALTALLAAALFAEPLTPVMLLGMALVVVGVLCVETGSWAASRDETRRSAAGTAVPAGDT